MHFSSDTAPLDTRVTSQIERVLDAKGRPDDFFLRGCSPVRSRNLESALAQIFDAPV